MTKCKVNINMEGFNRPNEGIIVHANELTTRLANYEDMDIMGFVPRKGMIHSFYNQKDYSRFSFPVKTTRFPDWMVNDAPLNSKYRIIKKLCSPFLPRTFDSFIGREGVFLFFWIQAPVLPVEGKVLTCVHDLTPFRVSWTLTPDVVDLYKRVFANVLEKSTKIITDSKFSKQDIMDYAHVDENNIEVVYCGVNAEEFQQPFGLERVRGKYNLPEKYILYFGTCGPRKNVESIIRAYACLPEAARKEYALVITNPTEVVKSCAVENNVTPCYVDGVSAEDKSAVYQMASLLVWLSIYEGFGLPIVEAQAAGTPVVCSNVTSLPEVAGDAAVLVDPVDTATTTAAIERCLYDKPLRQDLIAKGHENVKRFSWDESAKKLHDIILSL